MISVRTSVHGDGILGKTGIWTLYLLILPLIKFFSLNTSLLLFAMQCTTLNQTKPPLLLPGRHGGLVGVGASIFISCACHVHLTCSSALHCPLNVDGGPARW